MTFHLLHYNSHKNERNLFILLFILTDQTPIALSLFTLSFTLGGKTAQFSIHSCRLESTNTQMLLIFKIRIFITSQLQLTCYQEQNFHM